MTYQNYEFTAFQESDLVSGNLNCGDTFTMPGEATVCFNVYDNDGYLSGDSWCNENANDSTGQTASIEGPDGQELGNGGQIYAEVYHWVKDSGGNWYLMIEIEQEGASGDYFTFHEAYGVPAEGTELTVHSTCNVKGNWVDYNCLDSGEKVDPAPTGAICGRLTEDVDCDNTEFAADGGFDEGLEGQTVELYGWNGSSSYLVATTTTNADGSYDFPGLEGGWYYVQFPELEGYDFADKDVGVEHADSDANAWGSTDWICLGEDEVRLNVDASVKPQTGSISGTVWCDEDCDGINESGVIVEGCDYTIEAEHMQKYGFTTVSGAQASADCLVKLNCAGGWGDLTTEFSGKDGTYDVTIWVQDENDGQSTIKLKVNGEMVEAIRLDADTDGGGSNDGGFSPYVIKDVELKDGDDITLWADGDGYEFVRIDKIDLEGHDTEVSGTVKGENLIVNGDFENNPLNNTGWGLFDSIEGWDATVDKIEIQESNYGTGNTEGNAVLELDARVNATVEQQVEITEAGNYCFSVDYAMRGDNAGTNGFAVYVNGVLQAEVFPTESGFQTLELDLALDAGTATIELVGLGDSDCIGTVLDNVMLQKVTEVSSEPTKAGVVIKLIDADTGEVVATTETDADGNYSFDGVPVGDYKIMGVAPNGTEFTIQDAGSDDSIDSDVDENGMSGVVTVTKDGNVDVDLGVCEKPELGALSGRYFCDENRDATEDNGNGGIDVGVAGATVWLLDAAGNVIDSTTTDSDGNYRFDDLEAGQYSVRFEDPADVAGAEDKRFVAANQGGDDDIDSDVENVGGAGNGNTAQVTVVAGEETMNVDAGIEDLPGSLSGRYFCDTDNDDQDNNNGDEPGVEGILVTLLDANGNPTGATTTTDAQGNYSFGDLAPGTYGVTFTDPDNVLDGKALVDANVGDDASDSDAIGDTSSSTISTIVVSAGQDNGDNDAGVEELGSLSGRYFCDTDYDDQDNNNGDEPGVEGILVTLLDANGNPTGATTTTGADGSYSFAGLAAATYGVMFTDPNGVLGDKTLVDANVGDDASDSDAIGDATMSVIENISVVNGQDNGDNDAGVEELGSLSGRYFCDDDRDGLDNDGADNGVEGITVELLDANGDGTGITTTTDANGAYSFSGLVPGSYGVQFTDPNGVVADKFLTTQDVDGNVNDDIDSDAAGDNVTSSIEGITVVAGQDTPDNDAGVFPNEAPTATDDAAMTCADEAVTINLLDNDVDADGDTLSVVSISDADETVGVGGTITLAGGALATLNADGTVTVDGSTAYADLLIRDTASDSFSYSVTDGLDVATASVGVEFCGAKNTLETIDASLNGATVTYTIADITTIPALADAWTLDLLSSSSSDIPLGIYTAAYCIDSRAPFDVEILTTADISVANEANALAAGVANADKIDSVNWLLNNDFTQVDNGDGTGDNYTDLEVQEAIWILLNGDTFYFDNPDFPGLVVDNQNGVRDGSEIATAENAMEIAMAAMNSGDGFEAGSGQIVGLILDPTDPVEQEQPFIIGVEFDALAQDCICL